MDIPVATVVQAPKGYRSEEARSRFMLRAALMAVACIVLQFIIPMAGMLVMMPVFMIKGIMSIQPASLESLVWHDGTVWYTSRSESFPPTPGTGDNRLMRLVPGSGEAPQKAADLDPPGGRLLAADGGLWIVSPEGVAVFRGGQIDVLARQILGDCSRPFLYEGHPAVYEELPGGTSLTVFRDGQWQAVGRALPPPAAGPGSSAGDLRVVAAGNEIHCFRRTGQAILHWSSTGGQTSWQPVANPSESGWTAVLLDGAPAVFFLDGGRIVGRRLSGGAWQEVLREPAGIAMQVGACGTDRPGEFVVAVEGFPGSLQIMTVRNGKVTARSRHGSTFPFFPGMIWMILAVNALSALPLGLFALLLAREMRRARVGTCSCPAGEATYASVWRRACAQIVDTLIVSGPLVAAWIFMMTGFFDAFFFDPAVLIHMALLTVGGLFWSLLGFLLFSWMEGVSGQSPGKRLLGIRVTGLDLRPIGFGRALVRRLLLVADSFFYFMVGMLLVAFTENWQRLGDMAAKAIVVEVRPAT